MTENNQNLRHTNMIASGYLITIDGGTTNTRAFLWKDNEVVAVSGREAGVRNTAISHSKDLLKQAVKACISEVMADAGIEFCQLSAIVASGMLTSNVGLVEIPHLTAPVTASVLASEIREILLPDICPVPIHFIPGVKNNVSPVTGDTFEQMDMMRGEETETFALLKDLPAGKAFLIILPGSHTKFVSVDISGAITGCLTTINGELLSAVTNNTILANAVGKRFVSEETYDADLVQKGAEAAEKTGLGRACFSGRILSTFVTNDQMKIANFLLGAVLQGDINALQNSNALSVSPDTNIIIAGKNPLRQALFDILENSGYFKQISVYIPEKGYPLSGIGAKYLYELKFRQAE